MSVTSALIDRVRHLAPEVTKFLSIGLLAYVVDVGVFNLLRFAGDAALLAGKPLTAKVVSTAVAMVVAYLGNKKWTYGSRSGQALRREITLFIAFNIAGMAIALVCLAVSHYALGLTSPLADNISANVIGLVLGTAFRFVTYRRYVFTD